jgi:predicted transcriptional regulator
MFAHGLMAGTKTAEVRRRFPMLSSGTELFVYSSSPVRAVVGTLILDGIDQVSSSNVWAEFGSRIEIGSAALDAYLEGKDEASILAVRNPDPWESPVSLETLRAQVGVEPPQSWRYLDSAQGSDLRRLGRSVISRRISRDLALEVLATK